MQAVAFSQILLEAVDMATLIGAKVPVVYTLVGLQVDVMSCRYMQRIKWVLVTTTRSINRLT